MRAPRLPAQGDEPLAGLDPQTPTGGGWRVLAP